MYVETGSSATIIHYTLRSTMHLLGQRLWQNGKSYRGAYHMREMIPEPQKGTNHYFHSYLEDHQIKFVVSPGGHTTLWREHI